jgi:hypothetical protein
MDIVTLVLGRLTNRLDVYGKQVIRAGKCEYFQQKPGNYDYRQLTGDVFLEMLNGGAALSFAAKDEHGRSRWLVFDSDRENGDLDKVAQILSDWGFQYFRCNQRPGREGHLWVLVGSPIDALLLCRFAQELLAHADVERDDKGRQLIEFFPKPGTGYSQIRSPLSITRKPGADSARAWVTGVEQDVTKQLEYIASCPLNQANAFALIAAKLLRADALRRPHRPVRITRKRGAEYKLINLLNEIPTHELRQCGSEFSTQCPACAAAGGDSHRDNLRIKAADGTVFNCVDGGPGYGHNQREILEAFGLLSPAAR